ncbi:MAG: hypothetical protein ACE5FF_11750, partial [Saprospiraceae bacterium]
EKNLLNPLKFQLRFEQSRKPELAVIDTEIKGIVNDVSHSCQTLSGVSCWRLITFLAGAA